MNLMLLIITSQLKRFCEKLTFITI